MLSDLRLNLSKKPVQMYEIVNKIITDLTVAVSPEFLKKIRV